MFCNIFKFKITFVDIEFIIDNVAVKINDKIKDEDLFEYYIIDREDFIDTLFDWISEAKESDKFLMKQDLWVICLQVQ